MGADKFIDIFRPHKIAYLHIYNDGSTVHIRKREREGFQSPLISFL